MTTVQLTPAVAAWNNPETVAARGTVIVIAGRGEHPGVYERFGTRIALDGYRVRAVADPTVDADAVAAQVTDALQDSTLPAPRVLAGSDGGALFAAALVATGRVRVDALLLAGLPVAEAGPGPRLADSGQNWDDELTARTACPTHQGRLTGDQAVRRGALADELPAAWFADADLGAVGVPVLGLHGAADVISPLARVRPRYARAAAAELVSIADGRHDALNDATHRTAAATVVLFLERLRLGTSAKVPQGRALPEIAHREL